MAHAPFSRLLASSAIALALAVPFTQAALAQEASGRLTVREAPTDPDAVEAALQDRLSTEVEAMRDHAEAIRRGIRDLDGCTADADLQGKDASVPAMLDCFVDQAIGNERTLTAWANTLDEVETILADGAEAYAGLAEAKADEAETIRAQLDALAEERDKLARRVDRVRNFLATNGDVLENEALHEAHGLMLSWKQLQATEDHHGRMIAMKDDARRAFDQVGRQLSGASFEAALLEQEFADRATREGFYVAEIGEAAQLDVALEQAAGMMAGMARMGETLNGVRTALDAAHDDRPTPVASTDLGPARSLLGSREDTRALVEFFRTVNTGGEG